MKRFVTAILLLSMVVSLAACGGKELLSEEQIKLAEDCGKLAGTVQKYKSSNTIDDVLVLLTKEDKSVISVFEDLCGSLEYYGVDESAKSADAIVIESHGTLGAEDANNVYVNICGKQAGKDGELALAVLESIALSSEVAQETSEAAFSLGSVEYNGNDYDIDSGDDAVEGIKWLLAQASLSLDQWKEKQAEPLAEALTAYEETKAQCSGEWEGSVDFYIFLNSNSVYNELYERTRFIDYLNSLVDSLENIDASKQSETYNELKRKMERDCAVASIMRQKAQLAAKTETLLQAASEDFAAYEGQINELKKNDNYLDSDEFLKIKARSNPIAEYQDNLAAIELLDSSLKLLEECYDEKNSAISSLMSKFGEKENEYTVAYYQARMSYIRAVVALEDFDSQNADELSEYNSAVDEVKAKHNGDDYKKDVDYMKNELAHKDMLDKRSTLETSVNDRKAEVEKLKDDFGKDKENYEKNVKERLAYDAKSSDNKKIKEAMNGLIAKLGELNAEPKQSESDVLGELDGFVIVKMSADIISKVNSAREIASSGSGSSSSGRTCAQPGCNKKAVTSGDSVYCSTHSRRCLNCGCYIDADAMYCMDCLRKAIQSKS